MTDQNRTQTKSTPRGLGPAYPGEPEQPNAPEVSGTSFPLLSTVLAGFSITIAVQLILSPENQEALPGKVVASLIVVMLSALLFLSSTGLALTAQANNYLPFLDLGETGKRLLGIDNHEAWISRVALRWKYFYSAAVVFFFLGVVFLLAGVNLIVWEMLGGGMALALLIGIIANVLIVGGITTILYRRSEQAGDDAATVPESVETESSENQDRERIRDNGG